MFTTGQVSCSKQYIYDRVQEEVLLFYYTGISDVPCKINSPLRGDDKNPSFGLRYYNDKIFWMDFATHEHGDVIDLLSRIWNVPLGDALARIKKDLPNISAQYSGPKIKASFQKNRKQSEVVLRCKTRKWQQYDLDYWKQFGISLPWLKFADVYPISHIIFQKGPDDTCAVPADKLAYAYAEFKENQTTIKIYQPQREAAYKWKSGHDKSVISLWTKLPETGKVVCICSSLKDALCLWENTNIPAIALQGEGYPISKTAADQLRKRFKFIYVLFDNDPPGIADAEKLAQDTGFINITLPYFDNGKDISDLYKVVSDKQKFTNIIYNLFKCTTENYLKHTGQNMG